MDFDPFVLLLLLWGLLSFIGSKAKKGKGRPPPTAQRRAPPAEARRKPESFEDLLGEMRRELERAKAAELDTEFETLEEEPQVVSLEVPPEFEEREIVDVAAEAEILIQERLREAEVHNRAWRPEDHRKFDKRIRTPTPVVVRAPRKPVNLRQAIVWREILGKPVSLRES